MGPMPFERVRSSLASESSHWVAVSRGVPFRPYQFLVLTNGVQDPLRKMRFKVV